MPAVQSSAPAPTKLAVPAGTPLRDGLLAAFSDIIAHAMRSAGSVRSTDRVTAVHEFRKAVRRARAMLRVLRPVLSKRAVRRIDVELKTAHRSTSSQRDSDVLAHAFSLLAAEGGTAPGVTSRSSNGDASQIEGLLRRGIRTIAPLPDRLDAALPREVELADFYKGVQATYRVARRHLKRTIACADPVHIHDWRKRNKDIVYQLELLASMGNERAAKLRKRHAKLSEQLGDVTDLITLRRHLDADTHADAELVASIESEIAGRLAAAIESGKELYATPPKRVIKLVKG